MKIVVIGGTGVFGERLARMLVRDGHEVVIAGRRAAPLTELATDIGAGHIVLDRGGDLSPLWSVKPTLVIDAAGPFHAYGDDPYRLAKEAIGQGCHYLDLADDADFCAGITRLDAAAKATGVFALSGVSSVPALSSAVVTALADGAPIDTIETAILPGNQAPRGQAVVDSILYQAGTAYDERIAGMPTKVRSWSNPRWFDLSPNMRRLGFSIRVPDQVLFPSYFNAKTVRFHAGLELGLSNWGLAGFSWVRGHLGFRVPNWMARLTRKAASMVERFGTNTGGMAVDVVVQGDAGWERRSWRLVAQEGDGPFIPGVSARVIARMPDNITPGARPALAEFPLEAAVDAMDDLAVTTTRTSSAITPIFRRVLGDKFDELPLEIRDSHLSYGARRLVGRASVTRGTGVMERIVAAVVGFPKATDDIAVQVIKTPLGDCERWRRTFGTQDFYSTLRPNGQAMTERFGPLTFTFDLNVADGKLHYPVVAGRFLGVPMPRWTLPKSVSFETVEDGKFRFDVSLYAPLTGGLIVRYRGWLM